MRSADRIIFLIACPILLVLQIIIVCMFIQNQSSFTKPGNIFFALVILEIGLNLHLFISSSMYLYLFCSLLYGMLRINANKFPNSMFKSRFHTSTITNKSFFLSFYISFLCCFHYSVYAQEK